MSTVPADVHGSSDAELIASVRDGKIEAYGTLYERHVAAAYNLARQLAKSPAEADDLVSEAFSKVLDTLRGGGGPDSAFRAYLLTSLRHTAYDKTRRDRKVELSDDVTAVGGVSAEAVSVPFSDTAVAGLERSMAARAFASLPERWQTVLWHTEIEQQSPAEVAPILGLTANGVSALAYRAREGLRQAYLQVHLAETTATRCRATTDRLGAHVRDGLSKRERAQVEAHLDECDRCRALAAELADVNGALRGIIAPLVLGGAAAGYLATAGAGKAAAATVGAAAAGGSGAAAGAAAAGPRQFAGVAGSGMAIAAAVIAALAAGGGNTEIPTAARQPPPAVQQPPAPQPPAPQQPPAPPPAAPPPQQQPPPQQPPPQQPPPQPAPPGQPPQPPAPQPANLVAEPPPTIELEPGGAPTDLPITVRNNGGSTSEPVRATLNLPNGVSAQGGPNGFAGDKLLRLDAPAVTSSGAARSAGSAQPSSRTVRCPGGTGKVTCRTDSGLRPGQSVTLLFRLVANEDAQPGRITGSVVAGSKVNITINVPMKVKQLRDEVRLTAHRDWAGWFPWHHNRPIVHAIVRNEGESTKPVTVTMDKPGELLAAWPSTQCASSGESITCTTTGELEPGDRLNLRVRLDRRSHKDMNVNVTATLGTARDSASVHVPGWHWPPVPDVDRPTVTPHPDMPDEPDETDEPSSEPPTTTTPKPKPSPSWPGSTKPSLPDLPLPNTTGSSSSSPSTTTTTTTPPAGKPPATTGPPARHGGPFMSGWVRSILTG
ncbi:MAG: sigma-70 family RNA polymerase sigma factor [Pseudonocardiaceae bacterium]|nr:sigma-70 family RNA polymerase sigma factor [Pseudonocardiaceae bacterium]